MSSAARMARTALAARLLAHGFYAGQDQIMIALSQEDGQTPGQLATRLGVRPPTITKTINRLQAQGFLDKKASNHDARQAHIFLTDPGRDTIRAIEKSLRKTEKQALKGLDKRVDAPLSARLRLDRSGAPGSSIFEPTLLKPGPTFAADAMPREGKARVANVTPQTSRRVSDLMGVSLSMRETRMTLMMPE